MSLLPAPRAAAYPDFFPLGGNFKALLLHLKSLNFPLSPKSGKKFLFNHSTSAAWEIKPANVWAKAVCGKIAMIGSTVALETVSRMTLPDGDNRCPFLCPFCVTVPVKKELGLSLLPAYSHLLF